MLGATALLLVLVTWAASIGPGQLISGGDVPRADELETTVPAQPEPSGAPTLGGDRDPSRGDSSGLVRVVAFILQGLVVALLVYAGVRLTRRLRQGWRRRPREPDPGAVEFEVLDAAAEVRAAMDDDAAEQRALLAEPGEPRNAIVACWHRFELQAIAAGVERHHWQTTAEFVLDALDLAGADSGAVVRLADLYREARFSDHPLTDDHRRAALDALDAVHASMRVKVGDR